MEFEFAPTGVPVGSLVGLVQAVGLAAGTDSALPVLMGVEVVADALGLSFAATDRYSLHAGRVLVSGMGEPVSVIVPAAELVKAVKGFARERVVTLSVTSDGVTVSSLDDSATVRAVGGEFPRWRALIPSGVTVESGCVLSADPARMGVAVKALALVSGKWRRGAPTRAFVAGQAAPGKPFLFEPTRPLDGVSFTALLMPVFVEDAGERVLGSWVSGSPALVSLAG